MSHSLVVIRPALAVAALIAVLGTAGLFGTLLPAAAQAAPIGGRATIDAKGPDNYLPVHGGHRHPRRDHQRPPPSWHDGPSRLAPHHPRPHYGPPGYYHRAPSQPPTG